MTISHDYTITVEQGQMTVTLDGVQVMSGAVTVPAVAYFYLTASTGASYEQAVISNVSATVSVPSNCRGLPDDSCLRRIRNAIVPIGGNFLIRRKYGCGGAGIVQRGCRSDV